jgi:HSP20 family protein
MNVIKYDPFRELRSLQDEMTRLFAGVAPSNREEFMSGGWVPNVDIYENQDHLVLEADLPGMNRDDIDLSIENNIITLRGERKFEKKADGDSFHRVERSYGTFTRSFTLPQTVSAEGAQADFKNGILRVTLPKREETKARRIEVSGEEADQPKTIEAQKNKASA